MTPLRKRFQNHLTFKRFSPKTHEAYIGAVKGLANHYHKSPDKLSNEQIQDYFVYLRSKKICRYLTAALFNSILSIIPLAKSEFEVLVD